MIRRKKPRRQKTAFYTNPVIIGFFALLTTLLLFGFSQTNEKLVIARYYGDYGLYPDSQVLTLKKNDRFAFTYYGCSQNNGAFQSKWSVISDTLKLESDWPANELLSTIYIMSADSLISLNGNDRLVKSESRPAVRIEVSVQKGY
jgi:hypothetical protein